MDRRPARLDAIDKAGATQEQGHDRDSAVDWSPALLAGRPGADKVDRSALTARLIV